MYECGFSTTHLTTSLPVATAVEKKANICCKLSVPRDSSLSDTAVKASQNTENPTAHPVDSLSPVPAGSHQVSTPKMHSELKDGASSWKHC